MCHPHSRRQHQQAPRLCIADLNINSLRHKVDQVSQLLTNHNIDIIGLTETHLSSDFNDAELHIPHFRLFRKDRNEFGGGVAFYAKDFLNVTRCHDFDNNAIESIGIKVSLKDSFYQVCCVYQPPSAKVDFWSSLERSWDSMSCMETIVVGDFNADALDLSNVTWHHLLNVTFFFSSQSSQLHL